MTVVVILTRFAIRPDDELSLFADRFDSATFANVSWFSQRMEVFRRFTVPSVQNQTDKEFHWLIGVDASVPRKLRDSLSRAVTGLGEILETSAASSFNAEVAKWLSNHRVHATVRLDADDALSRSFVSSVKQLKTVPNTAYNFRKGLGLDLSTGLFRKLTLPSSPFFILVSEGSKHALSLGPHATIGQKVPLIEVSSRTPMFLKVLHHGSTSYYPSTAFPTFFVSNRKIRFWFGVDAATLAKVPKLLKLRMTISATGRFLDSITGRTALNRKQHQPRL